MRLVDTKKDELFIKLYKRGVSFGDIAAALKNKSRGTVWARYKRLVREKKISTVRV